ncbi:MAG: HEPN family nuclease [Pseudomonadota bacterium]
MSYFSNFERLFMQRTLEIVDDYKGDYDTTLLLNCLLGLLLVPNEKFLDVLPDIPIEHFGNWGLDVNCISTLGKGVNSADMNLKMLVRRLRNSVAHCRIEPVPNDHRPCEGFSFRDTNGFEATIGAIELKTFVTCLLAYLLSR